VIRYFCTYCDRGYLSRALSLYESLRRHCPAFRLWVLCFDVETLSALRGWNVPDLVPIPLDDFEQSDTALAVAKVTRSAVEYYFTCTPSVLLYVLARNPDVDVLSYVDADLFFFSDPAPLYQELGSDSVLIIEHRFPEHLRHNETLHGIYNVGLVAFRNDRVGHSVLAWWRERCLERCSDRASDGHFADQKYLDDWLTRFPNVVALRHQGAGLAPWNAMRYELTVEQRSVFVSGDRLIFYHFHNLRTIRPRLFDASLELYGFQLNETLTRHIYAPYLRALYRQTRRVGAVGNPRIGHAAITRQEVADLLVHGRSLVVCGRFVFGVHLKPLVGPVLKLRQAILRGLRVR
jgi:hypothetical protein